MPPNIEGLNIIQAQQQQSPPDSQDLLSGQALPDIAAQLDLWTNLSFESEDGGAVGRGDNKEGPNSNLESDDNTSSRLSAFALDPFTTLSQQGAIAPSLAQLLALHSQGTQFPPPLHPLFAQYLPQVAAAAAYTRLPPLPSADNPAQTQSSAPSPTPVSPTSSNADEPFAKRSRVRRQSTSTASSDALSPDAQVTVFAAAEDKRRRNTAASARFRLKKKEREAALEAKAKELENRVNELERECEGLRRENGWLKGLVVGVTGAAQAPIVNTSPSTLSATQLASLASSTVSTVGVKRNRDDVQK